MYGSRDVLPGGDLRGVPDAGDVFVARGAGADEGGFGDEEGARDTAALGVVGGDHGEEGNVGVGGAGAGQGRHE